MSSMPTRPGGLQLPPLRNAPASPADPDLEGGAPLPNLLAVYWAVSLSLRSEEPEKRAALASPANRVLLAMFTLHYINRTVIFPLRLRGGKDTPLLPFLMATIFCTLNGYMQARTLTALRAYPDDWLLDPRFICGPPTTPSLPSTPATAS